MWPSSLPLHIPPRPPRNLQAATLRDVFDQFAAFGAHEPSSGLEVRRAGIHRLPAVLGLQRCCSSALPWRAREGTAATAAASVQNRNFIKILKDARLLDKKLTQTDGDLIFTKVCIVTGMNEWVPLAPARWVDSRCCLAAPRAARPAVEGQLLQVKPKGAKKIGFEEFQAALKLVAEKKVIKAGVAGWLAVGGAAQLPGLAPTVTCAGAAATRTPSRVTHAICVCGRRAWRWRRWMRRCSRRVAL